MVHCLAFLEWSCGLHQWMVLVQVSSCDLKVWHFSHLITSDRTSIYWHLMQLHSLTINVDESTEKASKWTFEFGWHKSARAACCSAVALTWSHKAICRSFQREVPVERSIFRLPRISTLLALCVLKLASCNGRHNTHQTSGALNICYIQCEIFLN